MKNLVKELQLPETSGSEIDNGKTPKTPPLPPMVSARDLCANPPPTPPEIIEGILHQGGKMVLGGESKSFKTWILLHLSICIPTGREWLGFPTTQSRVLYVNFELPEFAIQKRIREICDAMHIEVPENLMLWNLRGHANSAETILSDISGEAKAGGFSLIVIDPLYKLLGVRDENSSRDMTNLMNSVERLTVETEAAVAFGSHYSKGNQAAKESMDRISGSGVFARDPDNIITMTQHAQKCCFTVEMTLRNLPPHEPFVVRREHPLMVADGKLDPAKLKKQAASQTTSPKTSTRVSGRT
jgi:RecA-family ATPase